MGRREATQTNMHFGFVRFENMESAQLAVTRMNGRLLEREELIVNWARYDRSRKEFGNINLKENKELSEPAPKRWKTSLRDNRTFKEALLHQYPGDGRWNPNSPIIKRGENEGAMRFGQDCNSNYKVAIKGSLCNKNVQWLERSLVLCSKCPLEVEDISHLVSIWDQKIECIRDMGKFLFFITLNSQTELEEAMTMYQNNKMVREGTQLA